MITAAHDLTRTCMHVIVCECSPEFSEAIPSMLLYVDDAVASGNSSGSDSGSGGGGRGGGGGGGGGGERTLGVGLKGRIGEGMRASGLVVRDKTSGVDRRRRRRLRRLWC
ncbi:hypothetical protein V1478_014274 [Vespula squamosa]|uniref:Uncharacterized protein n=1 Tax=Vespula squamosa TaxID=30214 RepID=A0ABD2A7J4_VESSQ